jgi:hypothetical protein
MMGSIKMEHDMKTTIVSLVLFSCMAFYGCSSDDTTGAAGSRQGAQGDQAQISQAETMEEIWSSDLDPAEKARRVQELLARSEN